MRNLSLLSVLAAFLFVNTAQAGLLIDPYVGTGKTKTALDAVGGSASKSDSEDNTSIMGARLGYSFLLLSAGIDYQKATFNGDQMTNTSLFVGVDLPILLRGWAEYFIGSTSDDSTTSDNYKFKNGYGIGIGFTGLPFVSINLEIQNINYTWAGSSASGYDWATAATLLSVSLPLDF